MSSTQAAPTIDESDYVDFKTLLKRRPFIGRQWANLDAIKREPVLPYSRLGHKRIYRLSLVDAALDARAVKPQAVAA